MKRVPTEIPIVIQSEYVYRAGDIVEKVRQQVEVSVFHLQTLFNLLKRTAENIEGDLEDEAGTISQFLYDVRNTSDMGYGITMSIWRAVSDLTELQMKETRELNEIEKPVESLESLAAQLSAIMKSPLLPRRIYDSLADELAGVFVDTDSAESILLNLKAQGRGAEKPVEAVKIVSTSAEISEKKTAEVASLALQLSAVLNNQHLPIEIFNAVMDSVGDIYNKGDNEMLNRFESSPEYLKALLLAYAKREISH